MHVVAEGFYNKLSCIVETCIVPGITDVNLDKIHRVVQTPRLKDRKGNTYIDINFDYIDKVTTKGDYDDTLEIFVPYGFPFVGSSYIMA